MVTAARRENTPDKKVISADPIHRLDYEELFARSRIALGPHLDLPTYGN